MKRVVGVLPALIGCIVIKHCGLLGTAAVLVIEALLLTFWIEGRRYDSRMLFFSTLGIGAGYILHPAASYPAALGIGSMLLTMIIHAAIFLILSEFLKDK